MATTPQQVQALAQAIQQQYTEISPADAQAFAQTLTNEQLSPNDKLGAIQTFAKKYPDFKPEGFFQNPAVKAALIGTGALIGASFLVPALTGGGAAAAGGADVAASMAPGAELGTTIAPAVTSAVSGGSSLLHSLLPSIIGAGASLGGTAIAANANSEAAKIAAAQADKALQVQQQQYALQWQDTAPYRALGQGAVNNLGFLGGIDTTSNLKALSDINPTVNPPPSTGVAPGAVDASGKPIPGAPPTSSITPPTMAQQQTNNTTLSQVGSGGTVRVQNPQTGMVHLIPASQVPAAIADGGIRV